MFNVCVCLLLFGSSWMPRHPLSDAHGWINEIPIVTINAKGGSNYDSSQGSQMPQSST